MANKKNTKKTAKKELVKKEVVKTEKVKLEKKEERKLLSDKNIAILYLVCALCWLVSGIFEYIGNKKIPYLDIIITVLLIVFSIIYFKKHKNSLSK